MMNNKKIIGLILCACVCATIGFASCANHQPSPSGSEETQSVNERHEVKSSGTNTKTEPSEPEEVQSLNERHEVNSSKTDTKTEIVNWAKSWEFTCEDPSDYFKEYTCKTKNPTDKTLELLLGHVSLYDKDNVLIGDGWIDAPSTINPNQEVIIKFFTDLDFNTYEVVLSEPIFYK